MRITSDWHIHTRHSSCGSPQATVELVIRQARAAGLGRFGITDHLHCRLNVPALEAGRAALDAVSEKERAGVHFGIEASCLRQYDLDKNDALGEAGGFKGAQPDGPEGELALYLPRELLERLRVDYVIGGAHWTLGAPAEPEAVIRSYHRQNMYLATHPRVDVVAHPWWWQGYWRNEDGQYLSHPWLGDFGAIPRSMHDEFASAARQHGTAVEINARAIFLNPRYPATFRAQYVEYLAYLKEAGVTFSVGSDSHQPGYTVCLPEIEGHLDRLGLKEEDLWSP